MLRQSKSRTLIVPSTAPAIEIAKVLRAGFYVYVENLGIPSVEMVHLMNKLGKNNRLGVAFDPLGFATIGENPFLLTYTKTPIKRHLRLLYVNDGLETGERTALEEGLSEIKELISILRCRSFPGLLVLQGPHHSQFKITVAKFISMLKEIG